MTAEKTTTIADAVRNLIVCDTQFRWSGETTLKSLELLDLQARGWLIEGDENNEFSLTDAGHAVVAGALRRATDAAAQVQALERIRDQLHAVSHQAPSNWCDVAASMQAQVQTLIDRQRAADAEVDRG